jgi:hypothetical protein
MLECLHIDFQRIKDPPFTTCCSASASSSNPTSTCHNIDSFCPHLVHASGTFMRFLCDSEPARFKSQHPDARSISFALTGLKAPN